MSNIYTYCYVLSITESNKCSELAINGASSHRQKPGSDILDRHGARATVAGRARSENPSPHGVERSNGNWVGEEVMGGASNGDGYDVDAVGDGFVKGGEHVHVVAVV